MQGGKPFDIQKLVREVCLGDESAENFCTVLIAWLHILDDIVDQDNPLPPRELFVRVQLEAAFTFADNAFFIDNREGLLALIETAARAFLDSLRWNAESDQRKRRAADVLKSQYQEVIWHVARLVGGVEHQREITDKWRHYQFDAE